MSSVDLDIPSDDWTQVSNGGISIVVQLKSHNRLFAVVATTAPDKDTVVEAGFELDAYRLPSMSVPLPSGEELYLRTAGNGVARVTVLETPAGA